MSIYFQNIFVTTNGNKKDLNSKHDQTTSPQDASASAVALNVFRRGRINGVGSISAAANPLSKISFRSSNLNDAQKPYGRTLENRNAYP